MIRRGPTGHRRGESHPRAKLTDEQVDRIRSLRAHGWTYRRITEAIGASYWTVRDIADYRTRL